jgi:hypothetical protein
VRPCNLVASQLFNLFLAQPVNVLACKRLNAAKVGTVPGWHFLDPAKVGQGCPLLALSGHSRLTKPNARSDPSGHGAGHCSFASRFVACVIASMSRATMRNGANPPIDR